MSSVKGGGGECGSGEECTPAHVTLGARSRCACKPTSWGAKSQAGRSGWE